MSSRTVITAVLLSLAAVACVESAPEPIEAASAPIIGGTFKEGDDAVVGLADMNQMSRNVLFCTGTLVSPHVVVAAGHCVAGQPPGYVYFGSDPQLEGVFVPVASATAHPNFDFQQLTSDIAVVVLAEAAPAGVTPYPIAMAAPVVNAPARFVGFGCRSIGNCGPYGEKYEVTMPITKVNPTDFEYGVATCNGDSGGPAFVMEGGREVLSGVTSWGDQDCSQFGVDTRVDAFGDWVRQQIALADPATCAGGDACASGCPAPDPDCPCASDSFCTAQCTVPGADPDCPVDCGMEGSCNTECPLRDPDCPVGQPDGATCSVDFDCASGVCEGVCRPLCDPAAPLCDEGLSCSEQPSGASACIEGGGDDGCGCRAGGASGAAEGGAWALALLALLLVKRRKRG